MLVINIQKSINAGEVLMDIGGGLGAIQHVLLNQGVQKAISVDASTAYIQAAREEAHSRRLSGRVEYIHGDFVDMAESIPDADIVTLDRVICCYHNVNDLVRLSAAKAKNIYAAVYPRDVWWIRSFFVVINFFQWLMRNPFRIFAHPVKHIDSLLHKEGLALSFSKQSGMWRVVVYKRETAFKANASAEL